MKIGLTGATGFIGKNFIQLAESQGHTVIGYSRTPSSGQRSIQEMDVSGLDAIVHLAGESVLGLWTKAKKQRIYDSRILTTRRIVEAMRRTPQGPAVLVTASGASFYGNRGDEILTESSTQGEGFLGEVVRDWEAAANEAAGIARVASVRFGMVLGRDGTAYETQRRLFRLGLGGKLGSGRQWTPWIHVGDAVRLLLHCVENPISGPVNGCAPEAVTNAEFTQKFAKSLHRPALLPAPAFALRMLPGGLGSVFLDSVRMTPEVALKNGFHFDFPSLEGCLKDLAS